MPVLNCPFPDCGYVTEDVDVVGAAAQLNIHALMHQRGGGTMVGSLKQRPPKIDRPSISVGATEEQWNTFIKRWNLFKQGTDIPDGQLASQLWQCCDPDLEEDLFKDVADITDMDEDALLQAIKRLAVITKARSVRKTELFSMKQDHGQPIRTFAAKVKGKAQVCTLSKQCPNTQCNRLVDYSEDIVKYVLISGICDEEIKKDVLGHENLDNKSLNETIAIIENKEMACRAMASSSESTMAVHHGNNRNSEFDSKLAIKTNCKQCQRQILKFKLRRGKFKEFTHCVQCWRKLHNVNTPVESREKQGAIFDVIATVTESIREVEKRTVPLPSLKHHIFDGTYGWMIKESKKQPLITLKLSTASSDYTQLNLPYPNIKPRKISAVADTGAQSSLMGLKTFLACGFKKSDLIPVRKCLYAANNEGINILGAVFARITGYDSEMNQHHAAEMIYVSDSTDLFYLSRNGMEQLKIISADFPQIGSANAISTTQSSTADQFKIPTPSIPTPTPSVNQENHENCECLLREKPPARPTSLPFEPTEVNVDKMKEWLIDRFASSTFNQCPHQPLPMMTGAPIQISIASDIEPVAVHTPSAIPIHWRDAIKKQLDDDVALGVIEKVPSNTPTTWCHRAIWVRKPDGSPRRVVDFQSLNKHCKRHTHHTVPPFNQARSIPSCTYRSVTDAWNGYHSVSKRRR